MRPLSRGAAINAANRSLSPGLYAVTGSGCFAFSFFFSRTETSGVSFTLKLLWA